MSHIYHASVSVSNLEKSRDFYDRMFGQLGWESKFEDAESKSYTDGKFDFWVVPAEGAGVNYCNDGSGFNHLAFRVDTREEVDAFYEMLVWNKERVDLPPQEYPHYSEGYYAVFFFDPDGARLEVVSL